MDAELTEASLAYRAGDYSVSPFSATLAASQEAYEIAFDALVKRWVPVWETWVIVDSIFVTVSRFCHVYFKGDLMSMIS